MSLRVGMPIIKDIIVESGHYGARTVEICRRAGLRPEELDEGERWIGLDQAIRVWRAALDLTGDPFLGLKIGRKSNPYVVGIVGYLMENCPSVGEAIDVLCRFNPLYGDMFRYYYHQGPDRLELRYEPARQWWAQDPETARQAIETSMTRTVAVIRHLSGKAVTPLQARFSYPIPGGDDAPYREHLRTNLVFGAPDNAMVFDQAVARLPVASHNRMLFAQFEQLASDKLQMLQKVDSLSNRIRNTLLSEAFNPFPALEEMATRLHLSPRTLQRRLKEEQTSYQDLIDELRRDMGLQLLKRKGNSVEEIAAALGYADPSALRRAVRRWTGSNLGNLREMDSSN